MWVDYLKATPKQQGVFCRANPKLREKAFRYRIWIKPDGNASRRKGHWTWTEATCKLVEQNMRGPLFGEAPPSKDDLGRFKTCDFHLDRS